MACIALLTDFGTADHYAGVLHAVLERDAPGCPRLDLSHQVAPGDVWQASYLLRCAWPHLPTDAVVLAVVDPGVGTARRAVAVAAEGRRLVAPDNGLATAVGPLDEVVELSWERMGLPEPSHTFHGRDLFAPAAARLAGGEDLAVVGDLVEVGSLLACPLPDAARTSRGWRITVLHVDRFGNVVTNLPVAVLPATSGLALPHGRQVRRVATYGEATGGEVVVLEGSSSLLELALDGAPAADATGLEVGDVVEVVEVRGATT